MRVHILLPRNFKWWIRFLYLLFTRTVNNFFLRPEVESMWETLRRKQTKYCPHASPLRSIVSNTYGRRNTSKLMGIDLLQWLLKNVWHMNEYLELISTNKIIEVGIVEIHISYCYLAKGWVTSVWCILLLHKHSFVIFIYIRIITNWLFLDFHINLIFSFNISRKILTA